MKTKTIFIGAIILLFLSILGMKLLQMFFIVLENWHIIGIASVISIAFAIHLKNGKDY